MTGVGIGPRTMLKRVGDGSPIIMGAGRMTMISAGAGSPAMSGVPFGAVAPIPGRGFGCSCATAILSPRLASVLLPVGEIRRLLPRHGGRKPDLVGQRSRPLCGEPRHITDLYCRGDAPAVTCVQHSAGCRGRNCANPRRAAGASAGFAGPKLPAKRRHAADPESRARRQSYSAGAAVGSGRARPA
jgi:hypothetical protein